MAASPRALLEWCRVTCASYPGVDIKNMSASFRDGLAFCAIIHKHRPDLIDFSSLSRGNVYQNNKLAFEVAEARLGIPPLLDPRDMVSTDPPDFLTVITYVSQYYDFFSGESHGPCRSWSSQVLNVTKVHKTLRSQKSLTELETGKDVGHADLRTRAVCSLCFKPVHLIQKHLADGKVFHRGCFRCNVCHCVLLPGSYTQGSDKTSFTCSHHAADRKAAGVDSEQQLGPAADRPGRSLQTGFYSLSGSAICSVPRYAQAAAPRRASEGSALPVPAPRRSLESSAVPVPAARSRTAQTMSDPPTATEGASESSPQHSGLTSPKVKSNHPWMAIVHPGPWTQLPPAPPPVPVPRSKTVSKAQMPWNRTRMPSLNPFEEEEEEVEIDEAPEQEPAGPTGPSAGHSEDSGIAREEPGSESEQNADEAQDGSVCVSTEEREGAEPDPAQGGATAGGNSEPADGGQNGPSHAIEPRSFEAQRSAVLPRSLSVPAIPSDRSETNAGLHEADPSIPACEGKSACKKNPFTDRPEMSRSQTAQNLSSSRGPAPGHGFPLVRRQVRTDQGVSTEDLQKQMRSLDGDLEALERRGLELERSIRDGRTGKEDQMLTEWFGLIREQHALLRKNKELVYLTKQQILEDRQVDVEFKLRCLLNKPEKDWDQEDRSREEQLMSELVTIIEDRNQIVSSLDQDRERDEDMESTRNKGFQKDGQKKTKGKLKAPNVFKMLNHKPESSKEHVEKKS